MSVERRLHRDGRPVYVVRWREGGRNRGRVFAHRRDAFAWDAEVRRRRRLGELGMLDHGKQTLTELHDAWWEVHAADIARNTRDAYALAWDKLIEPPLGQIRLGELTPLRIEQFMRSLLDAGVGEASAEKAWVVLSSMLRRAEAWGWIARNPARAARKPRKRNHRRVPHPLAPEQIEAVRAQLRQRDATLISVLGYGGLRPGEALALRWSDVGENTIAVARAVSFGDEKDTKTGRSRVVHMLPALRWDLRAWHLASGRPPHAALVFPAPSGGPWNDGHYRRWRRNVFKPAVVAAGLDPTTRVYDLRHSRATTMIYEGRNPIEIAAEMGHSPQVLLSTYAHVLAAHRGERIDPQALIVAAREHHHSLRPGTGRLELRQHGLSDIPAHSRSP